MIIQISCKLQRNKTALKMVKFSCNSNAYIGKDVSRNAITGDGVWTDTTKPFAIAQMIGWVLIKIPIITANARLSLSSWT